MFDPTPELTPDVLSPRLRLQSTQIRISSDAQAAPSALPTQSVLDTLVEYVHSRLPWIARDSGQPVGMWVEDAGFVESDYEPYPRTTPFVWVGVASWDAAEALYDALYEDAGLEDAHWIGGWFESDRGFRKIKIYPQLSS